MVIFPGSEKYMKYSKVTSILHLDEYNVVNCTILLPLPLLIQVDDVW